MARTNIFWPGPPIARNIQPICRPWTNNIYSFPNWPAHGRLNNWHSCLFCLLRQNISKGYFAFWGKISAETIVPFVEHDWLKWTYRVTSTIKKVACLFCRFFMNWWGKLRFTNYKILWGDNAWYGTLTRESGFDKSQCWKAPLFPNVCPRLVNKFQMGELIDHQKNVQQRKSECHLLLSRTLGVSLNIYRKPEIPIDVLRTAGTNSLYLFMFISWRREWNILTNQ